MRIVQLRLEILYNTLYYYPPSLYLDNNIHSFNVEFLSHYPLICNEIFGEAILWTQSSLIGHNGPCMIS